MLVHGFRRVTRAVGRTRRAERGFPPDRWEGRALASGQPVGSQVSKQHVEPRRAPLLTPKLSEELGVFRMESGATRPPLFSLGAHVATSGDRIIRSYKRWEGGYAGIEWVESGMQLHPTVPRTRVVRPHLSLEALCSLSLADLEAFLGTDFTQAPLSPPRHPDVKPKADHTCLTVPEALLCEGPYVCTYSKLSLVPSLPAKPGCNQLCYP